jgi:hypothetical protein
MPTRQPSNGRTARDVALPDENSQSWRPQDEGYPGRLRRPASEEDDRFEDETFLRDTYARDRFDRDRFDRDRFGRSGDSYLHWEDRASRDQGYPGSFEDTYDRERAAMNPEDRYAATRSGYYDRWRAERERIAREPRGYGYDSGPDLGTGGAMQVPREGFPPSRGGFRGKGPSTFMRSDERVRELVCEALTDDDRIDATNVEVVVKAGDVTLIGTVDDRFQKRVAEDCADAVAGVKDVQNQLRVVNRLNPDTSERGRR